MPRRWSLPRTWVLIVATLLGCSSFLQAFRLATLTDKYAEVFQLFVLNLAYWYVPALMAPVVLRVCQRFPIERDMWLRSIGVHVGAGLVFSVVHVIGMLFVRAVLFPHGGRYEQVAWSTHVQRLYFMNLDWTLSTYWAIVGLGHAMNYYREAQDRALRSAQLETKLVESQLKALQGQLHPHFLFNTLHAISALVHRDADAADHVICRLSDLLRLTLNRSGVQEIPLKEELEYLEAYVDIEQTRFQDRLTVRIDISPETLDVLVPAMILQPLVENAIKHGIAPKLGPGLVEVIARRERNLLKLEVHDDGGGMNHDAMSALDKGIGISNTRARLEYLYGSRYRFDFSNARGGLTVHIGVPWRVDVAPREPDHASRVA